MTKAAAYFLTTLRSHLNASDPQVRKDLRKLYQQRLGKPLDNSELSSWIALRRQPRFDVGIVLLSFAYRQGIIAPAPDSLFRYVEAAPEKSKKAKPRRALAKRKASR